MKKDEGFLLIDTLLSLSLIMLICGLLIPTLFSLHTNYESSLLEVRQYREFYVYVKGGAEVEIRENELCIPHSFCIRKR